MESSSPVMRSAGQTISPARFRLISPPASMIAPHAFRRSLGHDPGVLFTVGSLEVVGELLEQRNRVIDHLAERLQELPRRGNLPRRTPRHDRADRRWLQLGHEERVLATIAEADNVRRRCPELVEKGEERAGVVLKVGGSVRSRLRSRAAGARRVGGDHAEVWSQRLPYRHKILDAQSYAGDQQQRVAAAFLFVINANSTVLEPGHRGSPSWEIVCDLSAYSIPAGVRSPES